MTIGTLRNGMEPVKRHKTGKQNRKKNNFIEIILIKPIEHSFQYIPNKTIKYLKRGYPCKCAWYI